MMPEIGNGLLCLALGIALLLKIMPLRRIGQSVWQNSVVPGLATRLTAALSTTTSRPLLE